MPACKSLRVDLPDEAATLALAARLAELAGPGDVIALSGDLGSGKTTLARAFIRHLAGPDEEVPSPTFTLAQAYDIGPAGVWHFDLYRLARPEDALELGIEEAFAEVTSLIEWPERLGPYLPPERLDVILSQAGAPNARRAELVGHGGWAARLDALEGE